MNIFKKAYCRTFQTALKLALPLLPYRDPKTISKIENIPEVLKQNSKKKPLIVTDAMIKSLHLTDILENSLKANSIEYCIYDGVVANPTSDNVNSALELYKNNNCDCIIAYGGGSPMDCAKGVGALIARPNKKLGQLKGILKVRKKIPLLIAIPTTAGTGSETTLACVIVDTKTRHKYVINDFPLIPSYAVLDEQVTKTLPKNVTASTGMDALTHAIEAYIGKSGNKATRQDALEAAKLIFENIQTAYNENTDEARRNMLIASHKAGRSFSKAYVGYVHSLAHALGGKYNTPHGLANSVILPIVLKEYGKSAHKKLYQIAVYCNIADKSATYEEGANALIEKIKMLNQALNIPTHFDFIKEADLNELATYAEKEANPLYPVPQLWDKNKLISVYKIIGEIND
jgi:alcohol dehydrogenase class IV